MTKENLTLTRRAFLEKSGQVAAFLAINDLFPKTRETDSAVEQGKIESAFEIAYQQCFRTFEIAGQNFLLRTPFALFRERKINESVYHQVYNWGKASIEDVWEEVENQLFSPIFQKYLQIITSPKEKVIYFDLLGQKPEDKFLLINNKNRIAMMAKVHSLWKKFLETGDRRSAWTATTLYPGKDTEIYTFKENGQVELTDIYNFLYCVAGTGIDCARFVYHCLKTAYGTELEINLGKKLKVSPEYVYHSVGSWFFNPKECNLIVRVSDRIIDLKPGDVIHFHGQTGSSHNVIIQSVNLINGLIHYLQCTDWAPPSERGVHESFIRFNPNNPNLRLRDKGVIWEQRVCPTFPGEEKPLGWATDGDRYHQTNSMVVRLCPELIP